MKNNHFKKTPIRSKHIRTLGIALAMAALATGCSSASTPVESTVGVEAEVGQEAVFKIQREAYLYSSDNLTIGVDLPYVTSGEKELINATRALQKPFRDEINRAFTDADFWSHKDEAFEPKNLTGGFDILYEDEFVISVRPQIEGREWMMPVSVNKENGMALSFYDLPETQAFWEQVVQASGIEDVTRESLPFIFGNYYVTPDKLIFNIPTWYRSDEDQATLEMSLEDLNVTRSEIIASEKPLLEIGSQQHRVSERYYTYAGEVPVFSSDSSPELAEELSILMEKQIVKNQELIEDDAEELYASNADSGFVYPPHIHNVDFTVKRNDSKYLSLYLVYNAYTGGAHGTHYDVGYNFNLSTGHRLELKDMFKPDVDYVSAINEQIQSQIDTIKAEYVAKDEGEWHPYMGFETISEDQHFYLTDDSIVIFFDLYEIAPYAAGVPTFEVSFEELEAYLN